MKPIYPVPISLGDGDADYRIKACPDVCYTVNPDGKILRFCPFCESRNGWVGLEIFCSDPDCKT